MFNKEQKLEAHLTQGSPEMPVVKSKEMRPWKSPARSFSVHFSGQDIRPGLLTYQELWFGVSLPLLIHIRLSMSLASARRCV